MDIVSSISRVRNEYNLKSERIPRRLHGKSRTDIAIFCRPCSPIL